MADDQKPIRLLGICGSLRKGSNTLAVLETMKQELAGKAEFSIQLLDDVPLYNQDLDGDDKPAGVVALKQAIAAADGLVVASPEYNYGMSGVLKNAIDWASRPGFNSPLKDKPALIVTSSPGAVGGARAQHQILEVLAAVLARPVPQMHVTIAGVGKKVENGRITDADTVKFLNGAADNLIADVRMVRGRGRG